MYICNCNGINERQVKVAVDAGATCWEDVHSHFGFTPQCGKCQFEIIDFLSEQPTIDQSETMQEFVPPAFAGA